MTRSFRRPSLNRHWVFLSAYGLDRAFAFSENILRGQTKVSDKRFNFSSGVSQFSLAFLSDLSRVLHVTG